ncbi:MAG TPA: hypothetical protein VMD30_08340 [Tepidisphaeraceae bacterium]|nr:hypothetical protein [Tepidisphaeraceae bacterium]
MVRISAYILAADPAWIEASVLSYYDLVDRIVVSYDADSLGWTGVPIHVEQCLGRLRAIDRNGKFEYRPGHFARSDFFDRPMENDTHQRQVALNQASDGADWVLQFDTDEVLGAPEIFYDCIQNADREQFGAVDFPARWLYRQLGGDRFLEACRSFWSVMAGFPGPVAVKAFTPLRLARQCDTRPYRVDFRSKNSDPWHPRGTPVHRSIKQSQGIFHFSMIRDEESLRRKTETFSHARDLNWNTEIDHWCWCGRHPYLAAASGLFVRGKSTGLYRRGLRLTRVRLPQQIAGLNANDGGENPRMPSTSCASLVAPSRAGSPT